VAEQGVNEVDRIIEAEGALQLVEAGLLLPKDGERCCPTG